MKMREWLKRVAAGTLALLMLFALLPKDIFPVTAKAVDSASLTADPSTANSYEHMLGTDKDGNRYAGRIWADKSVFASDSVVLDDFTITNNSSNKAQEFIVAYSALGSTTTVSTTTTVSASTPRDIVLVIDTSYSMTGMEGNKSRMQHVVDAADVLISKLGDGTNRIGIVTYDATSSDVVPLNTYTNMHMTLSGRRVTITSDQGTFTEDGGNGTNIQAGIDAGMDMLINATGKSGRAPVIIILTDGEANRADRTRWENPGSGQTATSGDDRIIFGTILNAAYQKTRVEAAYGMDAVVYTVSVDLEQGSLAHAIMDPSAKFNSSSTGTVKTAYNHYQEWKNRTGAYSTGGWTFNQVPAGTSKNAVIDNINYSDKYFDVRSSTGDLANAFEEITEEIKGGANIFHPITDTVTTGTGGVAQTPLTFVDPIGEYMELKDFLAVTLYGEQYAVTKGTSTTVTTDVTTDIKLITNTIEYLVGGESDTITDPVDGKSYSLRDSVRIELIETYTTKNGVQNTVRDQELWVRIKEAALPLLKSAVTNKDGVVTYTKEDAKPIRLYYSVGVSSDILASDGTVMVSRISSAYLSDPKHKDSNGNISFYTNQYGELAPNAAGTLTYGDTHVSATPSLENRYYYHQTNFPVYKSAKTATGGDISWEDDEYGVLWYQGNGTEEHYEANKNPDGYQLDPLALADVLGGVSDTKQVYTFISFYRPTSGGAGEAATYLGYATWGQMAVGYFDNVNKVYINGQDTNGNFITSAEVGYTVSADIAKDYADAKNLDYKNIVACLGLDSWRVYRLEHMTQQKVDVNGLSANLTGTATDSYAPKYDTYNEHVGDLVIWLGNNGKLTLDPTQGFSLTKRVSGTFTELTGGYEFSIVFDGSADFTPSVRNGDGSVFAGPNSWTSGSKTLTVTLAKDQTVYVIGVPKDTTYTIKEITTGNFNVVINDDLNTNQDDTYEGTVTNNVFTNVIATNTEKGKGGVFITKEVKAAGDYSTPSGDLFPMTVTITGNSNTARKLFTVGAGGTEVEMAKAENAAAVTTQTYYTTPGANGEEIITLKLAKDQTVYIADLSHGAEVTVVEGTLPTNDNGTYAQATVPYTSSNYSGQAVENNGAVKIYENRNGTIVVHNTYTRTAYVSVNLSMEVTKNFPQMPANLEETFEFYLQKYDTSASSANWVDVGTPIEIKIDKQDAIADRTAKATKANILQGVEFNVPGTYSYQIVEKKGTNADITYDTSRYTFAVVVTDDGNGGLKAEVVPYTATYDAATKTISATFENEYKTAETHLDIKKSVTPGKSPAGFEFVVYAAEVNAGVWAADNTASYNGVTDAEGELRFIRTYKTSDVGKTYHFVIEEKNTGVPGWTYDATKYGITVAVSEESGILTAKFTEIYKLKANGEPEGSNLMIASASEANVSFNNTYEAAATELNLNTIPTVKKELIGRNLRDTDRFTFKIYQNSPNEANAITGTIDPATINGGTAMVKFEKNLTFTAPGVYYYKISEIAGTNAAITYANTIYDMVVTVVDIGGQLQASYIFEDSTTQTATFTNTYTATNAQAVIGGAKVLTGEHRHLNANEFAFELLDASGNQIATTTNNADGTFTFAPITYTLADMGGLMEKTFTYTIKEIPGTLGGITYNSNAYEVTVKVKDNGAGKLEVVADSGAVVINNVYDAKQTQPLTISGNKALTGRDLETGEFTFALLEDGAVVKTAKNDAQGNFSFTFEADYFKEAGIHYFVLAEARGSAPAVTYDPTEYAIEVRVSDDGNGILTAAYSPAGSFTFVNTYNPSDAKVVLKGTKTLTGRTTPLAAGEFSFSLYRADENYVIADPEPIWTVENDADGNFVFPEGTFTVAGDSYYVLVEDKPSGSLNGITYDAKQYKIHVAVTDLDAGTYTGALKATVTVNGGQPFTADAEGLTEVIGLNFTNTYDPGKTEVKIGGTNADISATKSLSGKDLADNDFTFKLWKSNDKWEKVSEIETVKNAASGEISFTALQYEDPDTYYYIVEEVNEGKGGITYDDTLYYVTVKVTDNQQGALEATTTVITNKSNAPVNGISFANTYKAEAAKVLLEGTKSYDKPLKGDDFTFILKGKTDTKDINEEKTNDRDGKIAFTELVFEKAGTYNFTVEEKIGILGFIEYSKVVYEVKVVVTDNNAGKLIAAVTVNDKSDGKIVFENAYKYVDADDEVTIGGTKKLSGFRTQVKEGEFSFGLYKGDQEIEVVKVKADGTFAFKTLTYGVADIGTHTYTVKEIIPAGAVANVIEGRTYDTTVYTVTVDVVDNNEGKIVASAKINGGAADAIVFNNKYEVEAAKVNLAGTKSYDKPLKGDDFTFILEGEIDGQKIKQEKKNTASGSILFDELSFTKEGEYTFSVKEKAGKESFINFSQEVYQIKVTVKDNDAGKLIPTVTVNDKSDGKIVFANDYHLTDADRELVLSGTKKLTGRDLIAGEFAFGLYNEKGELIETVTNNASGVFTFSKLSFQGGENETVKYTYTVKEIAGSDSAITYDKAVYTVIVTLEDNNQGGTELTCTVNGVEDGKLVFNNVYVELETPETGDKFPIVPITVLMLMSAAGLTLVLVLLKRRKSGKWSV